MEYSTLLPFDDEFIKHIRKYSLDDYTEKDNHWRCHRCYIINDNEKNHICKCCSFIKIDSLSLKEKFPLFLPPSVNNDNKALFYRNLINNRVQSYIDYNENPYSYEYIKILHKFKTELYKNDSLFDNQPE